MCSAHRQRRLVSALLCAFAAALAGSAPASARVFAPGGAFAGEVSSPEGVAVDQSSGLVYVADNGNNRIDEFTRAGVFVRAVGFGVRDGANQLETCTTATTCREGLVGGGGAGETKPVGIAVDSSTHRVYVSEPVANRSRVQEFTEAGTFVTMFGKGVDKGPSHKGNVCSAAFIEEGDECGGGEFTTGPGGFGNDGETALALPLAIDASGDVWVGDINRLERFSASGEFIEEVTLPAGGRLGSLGVDTLGNLYVLDSAEAAVQKLDAKGTQLSTLDGPPGRPRVLTLGGAEGLYVGDEGPPYSLIRFNAKTGAEQEVFGVGSIIGRPNSEEGAASGEAGNALAFDEATDIVYAASTEPLSRENGVDSAVAALTVPPPGPLQHGLKCEAVRGTRMKLAAVLNAEGAETEYRFQYVDDATFKADGGKFDHASSSEPQKLAASFAETQVSVQVTGLTSETDYHFRLTGQNADGQVQTAEGAVEASSCETTPPVEIAALYVTGVSTDSATLNASINPEAVASSYHFEYLPTAAYQANVEGGRNPFTGAAVAPSPDGSLGEGEADVDVAQALSGLLPGTSYQFRVVGSNIGGTGASVAKAFFTRTAGEATLPDGRNWELVSPLEKHGGLFEPIGDTGITQAAQAGGGITYLATRPTEASPEGYLLKEQVLSQRTPGGWVSRDLSLPHETAPGVSLGTGEEYRFFSADLSRGIAQPFGMFDPAVSAEASEETPLLRGTAAGEGYQPLVIGCPPPGQECRPEVESHANVPPGTRFGISAESLEPCTTGLCGIQFVGASPDGKHVVLESPVVGLTSIAGDKGGLYEWAEGRLTLISRLPNNSPASYSGAAAAPYLGRRSSDKSVNTVGAVSADGNLVDWTFNRHLYQRNVATEKTIQIDAPSAGAGTQPANTRPEFQFASADGKVVYFTDEQKLFKAASPEPGKPDLYRCVVVESPSPKCEVTDLTPGGNVQGAVLGGSSDGASVYFVADGKLAAGAKAGDCENAVRFAPNFECALYEWREGTTKFVAMLSGEDEPDWYHETSRQPARVSPNGQWLEFMSQRSLTGYENTDVHSGEPDEEVFLYDDATSALACVSCNPSGQRPAGAEYGDKENLSSGDRIWQVTTWIAASVPGWASYATASAEHQPRYLSDSGRLFFNSRDDLATTDTNSAEDVYQFEPSGVGGCVPANASFVAADGGCLNLISSGTSSTESAFLDASESGSDAFFLTAAQLAGGDEDGGVDVYDAHVCLPSDPCLALPPTTIEECLGEACQAPGAAPAEPAIASLIASGLGNLSPLPEAKPEPKPKKLTPAQRRARALKACRRQHSRKKARAKCEAKARKAYRAALARARRNGGRSR